MSDNPQAEIENLIAGGSQKLKLLSYVMIFIGLAAIVFPYIASISIEIFVGWLLLGGGVIQIIHTVQSRGHGGFFWSILVGLLQVAIGLTLLVYPLSGIIVLTVFLAVSFVIEGVFRTGFALQVKPHRGWIWSMFSGLLSIFVGIMLYVQLPDSALWAVGLLVGASIAMAGWSLLMLANTGAAVSKAMEN